MNLKTDAQEAALDVSRRNMHKHVRRKYDTPVACMDCKKPHIVSDKTISYLCPYCGKFNNVDVANKKYLEGDFEEQKDNRANIDFPNIKDTEHRDYMNLRDEYEIRADLYAKGKTRDSVGEERFNRMLKKELIKNKCYRGQKSTGV